MSETTKLTVFVIDDDASFIEKLNLDPLFKAYYTFEGVWSAADLETRFTELEQKAELILLDLYLSDAVYADGLDILIQFREKLPHVPVVITTNDQADRVLIRAIKMGATDYLRKSDYNGYTWHDRWQIAISRADSKRVLHEREQQKYQQVETQLKATLGLLLEAERERKELEELLLKNKISVDDHGDLTSISEAIKEILNKLEEARDYLEQKSWIKQAKDLIAGGLFEKAILFVLKHLGEKANWQNEEDSLISISGQWKRLEEEKLIQGGNRNDIRVEENRLINSLLQLLNQIETSLLAD